MSLEDVDDTMETPLPNVKSPVLRKVVAFLSHHDGVPPAEINKPLPSADLQKCGVSKWDNDFIDVDHEMLHDLVVAANYLDCKPLLDLSCAKIAAAVRDLTGDELLAFVGRTEEFTPEEEDELLLANSWCA